MVLTAAAAAAVVASSSSSWLRGCRICLLCCHRGTGLVTGSCCTARRDTASACRQCEFVGLQCMRAALLCCCRVGSRLVLLQVFERSFHAFTFMPLPFLHTPAHAP